MDHTGYHLVRAKPPKNAAHTLTMRGRSGTLVYGYRTAATLADWTIHKAAGGWRLIASVVQADAYQIRQAPLVLVIPRDRCIWSWDVHTITVEGRQVRATLGLPQQG